MGKAKEKERAGRMAEGRRRGVPDRMELDSDLSPVLFCRLSSMGAHCADDVAPEQPRHSCIGCPLHDCEAWEALVAAAGTLQDRAFELWNEGTAEADGLAWSIWRDLQEGSPSSLQALAGALAGEGAAVDQAREVS